MPNTPQTWPGRRPRGQSRRQRYSVLFNGQEILLKPGTSLIGRSPSCQLVLDEMLVSRKHARLLVSSVSLVVEDLGSTNGVYVNDRLIDAPTALSHGDRVLIGPTELSVFAASLPEHRGTDTPPGIEMELDEAGDPESGSHRMPTTARRDAFSDIGRVADRMLATGRPEVAAQLLGGHMKEVLTAARSGRQVARELRDATTHYAVKLGVLGNDPTWVNLAIELNLIERRPLPDEEIELLAEVVILPEFVDHELFRYYQEMLRANAGRMSPVEAARARRIVDLGPAS